jgi:hypothetical protein
MSDQQKVAVVLTVDQARALLCAWEIGEFPLSNPLGEDGDRLLEEAEAEIQKVLAAVGVVDPE